MKTNHLISPHQLVSKLKGFTSNLLRQEFLELRKVPSLWNRSYFVSTYGRWPTQDIKEYIKYMEKQQKKYRKYIKRINRCVKEKM